MKTLLTLCLVLVGLAGFATTRAEAAQPATASVHQNYTEVVVDTGYHRHYRHHYYHHYRHHHHYRHYYYRHHRHHYYR